MGSGQNKLPVALSLIHNTLKVRFLGFPTTVYIDGLSLCRGRHQHCEREVMIARASASFWSSL